MTDPWEDIRAVLLIIVFVSFLIGIVFFLFYFFQLLELKKNNIQQCVIQRVELEKLELLSQEARQTLVLLERDTHPSNWEDVKAEFDKIDLDEATKNFCTIKDQCLGRLFRARSVQSALDRFEKQLHEHRTLLTMILQRPMRMSRAKFDCRLSKELLSEQIDSTLEIVEHQDITEKTKQSFIRIRVKFSELVIAMTNFDHRRIDWLSLQDQLNDLSKEMEILQSEIERDKDAAMRARADS